MLEASPNFSELSIEGKDSLIVRLFAVVEDLQSRVALLEAENQELRGKLAKNSQNSSKPPSSDGLNKPRSRRACVDRAAGNRVDSKATRAHGWSGLKNRTTRSFIRWRTARSAVTR
jgi:hypothetical protein